MTTFRIQAIALGILIFLLCGGRAAAQTGSVIYVTDLGTNSGSCSLTDAIFSSMYHSNISIFGVEESTGQLITGPTGCVVGQGDDLIVLPTSDVASLPDTNGMQIPVHDLDMVKFKNRDLTVIVK